MQPEVEEEAVALHLEVEVAEVDTEHHLLVHLLSFAHHLDTHKGFDQCVCQ